MVFKTKFQEELEKKLEKHVSLFNAHAHIDRALTSDKLGRPSMTMQEKQSYTGELHRSNYFTETSLTERMSKILDESIELNIKRIDSFIDVATDIPLDDGLGALNVALKLKEEYKDRIDFRLGAYSIFGFKDSEPKRWDLFVEAAKKADFIGTLPERDDNKFYKNGRDHIGFEQHFMRTLELAFELEKPIHYHLDQQNNPNEKGTETLIEAIRWFKHSRELVDRGKLEPLVWAVHVISPSCYEEKRFLKLVDDLVEYNVGVITCPTAAISMKQLSQYTAPIHNSIGRVIDMLYRNIPVRIGTDNIDDIFMRLTTPDLVPQILALADYTRFDTNPSILAKVATGKLLDADDVNYIKDFLKN